MGREGHHAKIFRQTFISHSNFAHLKPLLLYHIPIFFIKNTAENPAFPLGFSAVILFSCLCSDFRPVLEGHPDIVFAVHCDEIHQAAPQPGIELLNEILIPKLLDEAVHLTAPGLAILDGFTVLVVLRLRRFIPSALSNFASSFRRCGSFPADAARRQWCGRYSPVCRIRRPSSLPIRQISRCSTHR